jgi:hypothetical protein
MKQAEVDRLKEKFATTITRCNGCLAAFNQNGGTPMADASSR